MLVEGSTTFYEYPLLSVPPMRQEILVLELYMTV